MESKIIANQKNGKKLCFDGFMYVVKHSGKKQITWRCEKNSSANCKATIKTDLEWKNPSSVIGIHTHPGSDDKIKVAEARQNMKRKAESTLDKPTQILASVVSTLPDEVSALLPSEETCRRTLRNIRSKKRPKDPKTLEELSIEDDWKMTSGPEPRLFLQLDNGKEAPERLLVFGTDESLQLLAGSTSWFMDGTFSVVSYLFGQLYVIHGEVGTDRCPLLYALMQRQTQSSYEELFNFISSKCHADPSSIMVDFEKCVHQAIRSVFGNDIAIRGCFYHLTQSTWRKIQNLGLTDAYKDNEEFRLFCGQLDSLALLPIDRVQEGMAHLKTNIPEGAQELVEYFDSTYVSGQLKCRQPKGRRLGFSLHRAQPTYPPETWNCHEATMSNTARSNNICEGWNNGFANLVGQQQPSLWKLIENLRKEEARVHVRVVQDERGVRVHKRKRRVYEELQKRLKNLLDDLIGGRKDIPQFLRGVSHNIRFGQPHI